MAVPSSPQHQQSLQRTCRALAAAAAHEADILESMEEAVSGTGFDVATAIALAGCAFESYNEPTRVSAKFQERSSNGTVTTYVERWGGISHKAHSTQEYVLALGVWGCLETHSAASWPCREFLASVVAGVLEVHVEGAKNLRAGDVGLSPFMRIKCLQPL